MSRTQVLKRGAEWFTAKGWKPQRFQKEAWRAYLDGKDGLVNAPTGSGKTYSLMAPMIFSLFDKKKQDAPTGLRLIWVAPIRALTKEILQAAQRIVSENNLPVTIGIRTGDTPTDERARQRKSWPTFLITTPESLHMIFCTKDFSASFKNIEALVVDEWHELLGTKRGVLTELVISKLKALNPQIRIWGISATIGNLEEAKDVLLGMDRKENGIIIRSQLKKKTEVVSLMPQKVESIPWAGHLGSRMVKQVCDIIEGSESTLIFTNVRSQCEWWYKQIIEKYPELAGILAIHHGSLDKEIRHWVEDALGEGRLKAVVCTSSLDLGVDFGPVETIVQVGGPKGVARFVQRSGRSGHRPGAVSRIYFLPTHTLELIEAAALRQAIKENYLEEREPFIRCFDVLVQYLVTLATGEGFFPDEIKKEIFSTHCFSSLTNEEWNWALAFITSGGVSLFAYPEFHKVVRLDDGRMKVTNQRIARRHRLSVGTIVGDTMVSVRLQRGGILGHLEENFISSLNDDEAFWFAGHCLELVETRGLTAVVRKSTKKNARIPAWQGGKLPLSSNMSDMLRRKLDDAVSGNHNDPELKKIKPILALQQKDSIIPTLNEFLVEVFKTADGYHAVFYPFEGRFVHEGLASLSAYRIGKQMPISFSLAYNDYGFELLSDQPIPVEVMLAGGLFSTDNLQHDILNSVNSAQLVSKRFREVATIAGLLFRGFPGEPIKARHLQASAQLLFQVFTDYDAQNLLLRQSLDEVIHYQLEWKRMVRSLERMSLQKTVITYPDKPTPFAFPIMVDRLREKMSSESLEERIAKMLKSS
ncbi:MAG: ligase-associated DNA damage response DEXH box helicase [Flavobacteriales bacterium]|nr:ligase-associated DNA damage response DEXH box helicase [Flavobacteriales bacterium]